MNIEYKLFVHLMNMPLNLTCYFVCCALASHQDGPGFVSWVERVVSFYPALTDFLSLVSLPPQKKKTNISKLKFNQEG